MPLTILKKYLLLFAILGLAVLAFSAMSHNVSATDEHLTKDGWEWHYDSGNPAKLTSVINVGGTYNISIPNSLDGIRPLTELGYYCFSSAGPIFGVDYMPSTIAIIDTLAFAYHAELTYVHLNAGLITIADFVFAHDTSLYALFIPATVNEIDFQPFSNSAISNIYFMGNNTFSRTSTDSFTATMFNLTGHAYQFSTFPTPGQYYNGLLMGSNIPEPVVPVTGSASDISWYVLVIALAIVGLMTYAGMRDHNFMLLSGISWMSVSWLIIVPLSMPLSMIGVVIGLLLCLWGVYKLVIA